MRERLFILLLILGFGILVIRLFVLQVIQGSYWRELAEGNRIKITKLPATRGVVYDRNGKLLVRNTPQGREYLYGETLAHVLGYIGQVNQEELGACDSAARDPFSKSLLRDSDGNLFGSSAAISVSPSESNSRKNSDDSRQLGDARIVKAHEIGQTSPQNCSYSAGDLVGKMGIEKEYDSVLRGVDGGILEEVNAHGQKIRQLSQKQPVSGENLKLTIDVDLQQKISQSLKGKKAAAVAQDPRTGQVLALFSSPSFNPNFFTLQSIESTESGKININQEINKIINDKNQPMFNRTIGGVYPPGSTFKIVTSLAALQEGKITSSTQIEDTGQISAGGRTFGNWYFKQYGKLEGLINIVQAIQRSNDIFFYRVGELLGIDKLSWWAKKFYLGSLTGIDLPGEEKGLVPDKNWKKEVKGENWYLGDDFITAIGQGDVLTTPLQVNVLAQTVANNGILCRPHLVDSPGAKNCNDLGIKKEYISLVKEGMKEVCAVGGTGWPFFDFGTGGPATTSADFKRIEVACKTGTAEAAGEKAQPHAWFTVFAPVDNPEIALTILIENGGEGSSIAGPIAKDILKWWLENKNK
jgi:penicillin-binding protein 2